MINNNPICNVVYKNLEDKIRTMFSTEFIINCFVEGSEMKYKQVFEDAKIKKILANSDLMYSIEQFLNNGLNLTKTSKSSFMHRNTLIYRIEKIKKLTGLNLKNFEDAVIFHNLLSIKKYFSF